VPLEIRSGRRSWQTGPSGARAGNVAAQRDGWPTMLAMLAGLTASGQLTGHQPPRSHVVGVDGR
jgi:hypothetical protein